MKRILIVEDDPAIRDSMLMTLEKMGYDVEFHNNGEKILSGAYRSPDIFLLDKQLPGMDGLHICRFLKFADDSKSIPVIILSASPKAEKLAREAGAEAFLEKPFKKQELLRMVEYFLSLKPG